MSCILKKNIRVNFVGIILGVEGVSKDNLKSRLDLVNMGFRHALHHKLTEDGITYIPIACYSMSDNERNSMFDNEKKLFYKVLKNLKLLDGYASNISNGVNV